MDYRVLVLVALVVFASGCVSNSSVPDDESVESDGPQVNGTSTPSRVNQSNNTVLLTDSGFQPAELTVEKGEAVTWISESSTSMWVASDRHPTHANYAGSSLIQHCRGGDQTSAAFDQCSTGDRFTFVFEKAGEWSYHNHKRTSQGGTITVLE